jgi:hypothetical protein
MNAVSQILSYSLPATLSRSKIYRVTVDGEAIDAIDADKADFAAFECQGTVEVHVETEVPAAQIAIKPFSRGIQARAEDCSIRFTISAPQNICIDVPGYKPLFLYISGKETRKPSPGETGVHYFAGGETYEVGELELKSGETLYIEGGAVLRGNIICRDARDVRICGRGVLDGSLYNVDRGEYIRSIIVENCQDVLVEDIIMIHPSSWMLVLARCERVVVRNLRQIGSCMSSDGIDICGSRHVLVEECCLRNDDDNIALKSVAFPGQHDWRGDISDIVVRRCMFLNGLPGNCMEIGYELSTNRVHNVVFEDIDVIYAHGEGAVFSIHNGDRAIVENIVWRNIRIEHYWDKLVDFRIVFSRYNRDSERGLIRNIRLEDIHVSHSYFNPGCSISLIGGYGPDHIVEYIHFENIRFNDQKITNGDQLELFTKNAKGITFA